MTIAADDVRRLLASEEADAALVVVEGRAELSDRELTEQAEELDTAVRNLGG